MQRRDTDRQHVTRCGSEPFSVNADWATEAHLLDCAHKVARLAETVPSLYRSIHSDCPVYHRWLDCRVAREPCLQTTGKPWHVHLFDSRGAYLDLLLLSSIVGREYFTLLVASSSQSNTSYNLKHCQCCTFSKLLKTCVSGNATTC